MDPTYNHRLQPSSYNHQVTTIGCTKRKKVPELAIANGSVVKVLVLVLYLVRVD